MFNDSDEMKYRKKKSQKSRSSRRSDHKHDYKKVIIQGYVGWTWGKRCSICGRMDNTYRPFSNKEFLKPEYKDCSAVSTKYFMTVKELRDKYVGIPIYRMTDRIIHGGFEYEEITYEENENN